MKKSKGIRMALLGAAGLVMPSCDETPLPPEAQFFTGVEECAAVQSRMTCEEAFAESQAKFVAEAPQYARKEECEEKFGVGNCETRETGAGSFIMPMMMGYMLGNAFRQPVYRGPGNGAMMRAGGRFYNVGTFAGAGRAAPFQPAQISQVRRGGFGATASSYRTSSGG